ncbi:MULTISPECIES: hypothetical protein [unclassified Nocardioides]|uniref:hypothetical protein n=1 Tax=unclassified Nocardioides TaxID=2615069 RepID=UPI000A26E649|nr:MULTISPECIES: hypothetical protein [unclassified Nocardioides]
MDIDVPPGSSCRTAVVAGLVAAARATGDAAMVTVGRSTHERVREALDPRLAGREVMLSFPTSVLQSDLRCECLVVVVPDAILVASTSPLRHPRTEVLEIRRSEITRVELEAGPRAGRTCLVATLEGAFGSCSLILPPGAGLFAGWMTGPSPRAP